MIEFGRVLVEVTLLEFMHRTNSVDSQS